MISPGATQSSISTADMSSHTKFRAQMVSLSPGSYYSISAMLEPRVLKNEWDPPSAPAPPPVTASRAAARRPPTHHATRTARVRVLAVPVGRCWLFQDFSLRRLLPGAARSDLRIILSININDICFEVWRVAHVSICNRPAL